MGRSPCCANESVNRGAWSVQEDEILTNYIKIHGEGKWRSLPQKAGLNRCGKSCRLRWLNYLRPGIKRGDISTDEEDLIIRLHRLLGNRWALIAGRLPGRTDNEIKNYWNTTLVKKSKGETSRPSVVQYKSEEKAPIKNSKLDIPPVIITKANRCSKVFISPREGDHLISKNAGYINWNGHSPTSSTPIDDDSLNFLMDYDVDQVLAPDALNSNFLHIHNQEMHENCSMIGGNNLCLSSSDHCPSSEETSLENAMKCDPRQPTLEELKRVASLLDLEDEWKEL